MMKPPSYSSVVPIPDEKADSSPKDASSIEPAPAENRCRQITLNVIKVMLAIFFVYTFIFAIGLLSDSFQVLGGAFLNDVIASIEDILENPFCGFCMGILLTVLCQSSSTATSIFITLVGSGLFTVKVGIYCIYGANVGTAITSTLVAFGNVAEKKEFAAAMACAAIPAVYDMLIVLVLFPLEIIFDMMQLLTGLMVAPFADCEDDCNSDGLDFDPIGAITEPIQKYLLVKNKDGLGLPDYNGTFVNYCRTTLGNDTSLCTDFCDYPEKDGCPPGGSTCMQAGPSYDCTFMDYDAADTFVVKFTDSCVQKEQHMFVNSCMSDEAIGGICFFISFVMMYGSLVGVVKCLKSVLVGSITDLLKNNVDKNLPSPFGWLTDYLYIISGVLLTFAVQSSSIVLSILTPIVAIGVISVERAYPITAGANLGTTITGLIAAFANASGDFSGALQVSLSHVMFNSFGIVLFFVIPMTRYPVIQGSLWIGKMSARYRWWAILYTILAFVVIPLALFGISLVDETAGPIIALVIMYVFAVAIGVIAFITWLQQNHPKVLPKFLKSWKFLPVCMRSIRPIHNAICGNPKLMCCKCCSEELPDKEASVAVDQNGVENHNFDNSEKQEVENTNENENKEKVITDL
ncbi:unnamed protein product [Oikopleura dioica]|uniref:Uncharacterized protein n=1 Tax=Oikopleura dioica TaxID=34765 RepID=E4X4E1_OIKDI|nr:unnamed protein product [Oikopleura dioica]